MHRSFPPHRSRKPRRSRLASLPAIAIALAATLAHGAGEIQPGAYCPLPEPGQARQCLAPAQQEYGDFFESLEAGAIDPDGLARVEADVVGGDDAYLALSTLSYGYYRLAQRVAAAPDADPVMVERLELWNTLLARAFEQTDADDPYREAVKTAALDIQRRAPPVRLACVDAGGDPARCDSTEAVIRGFNAAQDRVGIRGALERLIRRMTGGDS